MDIFVFRSTCPSAYRVGRDFLNILRFSRFFFLLSTVLPGTDRFRVIIHEPSDRIDYDAASRVTERTKTAYLRGNIPCRCGSVQNANRKRSSSIVPVRRGAAAAAVGVLPEIRFGRLQFHSGTRIHSRVGFLFLPPKFKRDRLDTPCAPV